MEKGEFVVFNNWYSLKLEVFNKENLFSGESLAGMNLESGKR